MMAAPLLRSPAAFCMSFAGERRFITRFFLRHPTIIIVLFVYNSNFKFK